MTEQQADQIILLLKDINVHLSSIETNTSDVYSVASNTEDAIKLLQKISLHTSS